MPNPDAGAPGMVGMTEEELNTAIWVQPHVYSGSDVPRMDARRIFAACAGEGGSIQIASTGPETTFSLHLMAHRFKGIPVSVSRSPVLPKVNPGA